jgi:hypothetical protein
MIASGTNKLLKGNIITSLFGKLRRKMLRVALGRELFTRLTTPSQNIDIPNQIKTLQDSMNWQVEGLYNALLRTTPKASLGSVTIPVVEHCNLRCRGCDHCAPLAEEEFMEIESFEKDMKRLSELSGGRVGTIDLIGGEPLLHPRLCDFVRIARKYFSTSRVCIITNALLLNRQPPEFWECFHDNNADIRVTKYPLDLDWNLLEEKAKQYDVAFSYFSGGDGAKESYHIPFDISGHQNAGKMFINCFHANSCIELTGGKLFTCTVAPNARHFNKYFNTNMEICEYDYIDIHKAKNIKEILDFISKPIPFCRYCNVQARTFGHPWQRSKREINEWTV